MEKLELELKELIISKYGSLSKFCEKIDMPWTTLDSILKRGVSKANIINIIKITRELDIDTESLASGVITSNSSKISTLAAHFEGDDFTPEELQEIKKFAEFVKNKRG